MTTNDDAAVRAQIIRQTEVVLDSLIDLVCLLPDERRDWVRCIAERYYDTVAEAAYANAKRLVRKHGIGSLEN